MAETAAKVDTAKLVKLLAAAKDLVAKQGELLEEFDAILGGRTGIADKLKTVEKAFDDAWCLRYAPGQTGRYVWRYIQDRPNIKRLLKSLDVDEVIVRAHRYVRSEDPFYVRARHNFGLFVSSINSWAGSAEAPAGGEFGLNAPVGDCKHKPACKTDQEHTRKKLAEMRS